MKHTPEILYQDDYIIIVNKPSDILSIPDRFSPDKPNLYTWLNEAFGKTYIVHRLDRETSGIMVFARTEEAHRSLSMQFEHRETEKVYLALLDGYLYQDSGEIDKPISPRPGFPGEMMVSAKGKASLTLFKVVERFKNFTLVEADIKTGRTHQIRVHFKSIGFPLAVDPLYGRRDGFYLSEVKTNRFKLGKYVEEERPLMSRVTLHALRLTFNHPDTGERVSFESPLPKDFNAVLNQLRKWGQ